jgi:hypothetical protein
MRMEGVQRRVRMERVLVICEVGRSAINSDRKRCQ